MGDEGEKELAEQIKSKVIELGVLIIKANKIGMNVNLSNHKKSDTLYYKELEGVELLAAHITKTSTVRY